MYAPRGKGAVFLTTTRRDAESWGQNTAKVLEVDSRHEQPFIWDLHQLKDTVMRGRRVFPALREQGGGWLDQEKFFDALRRAGYDAVETRMGNEPVELAVLAPKKLKVVAD